MAGILKISALALFALWTGVAAAQEYPSNPVRIVVPFAAGGPIDFMARSLGVRLNASFGQPVLIENRPGASTILGTENVVKSPPDGYTMLIVGAGTRTILPFIAKLPYDPATDLIAVSQVASSPQIFVASAKSGYKSLGDFVSYAKANPGKVNFGSVGNTTITYLVGAVLKRDAGIQVQDISYGGGAPAVRALLSGEIDIMTADIVAVASLIQAGKVVPLAVTSAKRISLMPNVPTVAEAGFPGAVGSNIYGLFVPKNTPAETVRKISQSVSAALKTADLESQYLKVGLLPGGSAPDSFEKLLRTEAEKWGTLAKSLDIRLQ